MAIVAALVAGLNSFFGWDLTVEQIMTITGPLLAFVVMEGSADVAERMNK